MKPKIDPIDRLANELIRACKDGGLSPLQTGHALAGALAVLYHRVDSSEVPVPKPTPAEYGTAIGELIAAMASELRPVEGERAS
jgi:hypothetical protein